MSVTEFRIIYALVFIPVALCIGCPLATLSLQWMTTGKWYIGVPLLILLLVGGLSMEFIGERYIQKIRNENTSNAPKSLTGDA